jgi:isopenicillin N synthase-like dioxygenase
VTEGPIEPTTPTPTTPTASTEAIPTIDLRAWRAGGSTAVALATTIDTALQRAGFLLVTGHGVDGALRAEVRAAARRFFALPEDVKRRYAVRIGGRGWLAPGVEANALVEGTPTPPDLKESFAAGPDTTTGDAASTPSGSRPTSGPTRCPSCTRSSTGTRPRCAGWPTSCWSCARALSACRPTRCG